MFQYNVQHDCEYAQYTGSGERQVVQERIGSGISENFMVHSAIDRYVINTHGQHNIHLIHAVLPRDITAPIPFAVDREVHHLKISTDYRTSQNSKRAMASTKTAEKKKVTEEKKAAAEAAKAHAVAGPSRKRMRVEDLI